MVGDWSTGDTGTVVAAEEPGGPDDDEDDDDVDVDEFRAPDPDDDWLERAVAGFSAWLDSAGGQGTRRSRLEDWVADNPLVKPQLGLQIV